MFKNQFAFQAFIAQAAVEAIQIPVLYRPAGLDVHDGNPALFTPAEKMPARKFRALIAAQAIRRATLGDHSLHDSRHASTAEAHANFDGRACPREAVNDRQDANAAAARYAIADEIERPFLIRCREHRVHRSRPPDPLALESTHGQSFLRTATL
jgi:hypothetical protein